MAKETETYKDMVAVLEENAKSSMTGVGPRDSDTELIIQILQRARGIEFTPKQMTIFRTLNVESVTRARRTLQHDGQYPPDSPDVARKRRIKSYELQQVAPKETAAGMQRRIESNA